MPPPLALAFAAFALALAFAGVARVLARAVQVRRRRHPVEITPCHWDVALGGWRRAWFADGRGAFLLRCPGAQKFPRCRIYGTGGWRPWPWPRRARNRASPTHPDELSASRSTFKCEHSHDVRQRSWSIALVWQVGLSRRRRLCWRLCWSLCWYASWHCTGSTGRWALVMRLCWRLVPLCWRPADDCGGPSS